MFKQEHTNHLQENKTKDQQLQIKDLQIKKMQEQIQLLQNQMTETVKQHKNEITGIKDEGNLREQELAAIK